VSDLIQIDVAKAEERIAAQMIAFTMPADPDKFPECPIVKRKRDSFPNIGRSMESGLYGMYRTMDGHAVAVKRCLRALRAVESTFDAIYVTGLSGVVPAATVAYLMRKEMLVLRKQDDHGNTISHGSLLEGDIKDVAGIRYMILDDFVSNAGTLRRLLRHLPSNGSLAGVMLYGHPRAKNEIKEGVAKIFHTFPHDDHKRQQRYHMVRRGRSSMLFDIIPQEDD
jgi:adenine/guanine phosphoribosyltransferase-like PRPP-binding protein